LFNQNIIKLSEVDSTNNYALSLKENSLFKGGLVITTEYQTSGMGQRGSNWESENGKNLLLSVVIEPNIELENRFDISKIVAISICDYLNSIGLNPKIKWPNDILVGKEKIAGVLTQNIISENEITHSVVGIGLNVNQIIFTGYSPKATSVKNKLGVELNLEKVRVELLNCLENNLSMFKNKEELDIKYLGHLFMRNKVVIFERKNQRFNGIIKGVTLDGLLIVEIDKIRRNFDLKEIKMLF
jgi:BirA family biotin operon repressor/biotin-[acetyl-CoA-carboxylase] ligase